MINSIGMTKDGGERIATRSGAILMDPGWRSDVSDMMHGSRAPEALFESPAWAARGELEDVTAGRGSAWFIGKSGRWVLRHYRRGGWVARVSTDHYLWNGEARVRAFAEWRLLAELSRQGLPVPKPLGARYCRRGLVYRCDLITERLPGAHALSALLMAAPVPDRTWRAVGDAVARLHAAGADHADLNAHNILVRCEDAGPPQVSVIDFDRGRLRRPGAWARRNLARLRRSLDKITGRLPDDRFSEALWRCLLDGYADGHALHL
jgi:3-deoxy-D-manno-octulosonic acid kinase